MGKNKEGLSNLTAYNKQHNKPKIDNTNGLVMSQHTNIQTHQYTTEGKQAPQKEINPL